MNLIVKQLDESQVKEFFPSMLQDGYRYGLELCALKIQGRKTLGSGHLSMYRYREETYDGRTMIMREVCPYDVPCIRVALDKPMRQSARESILSEILIKMNEKIERVGLPENHPYRLILK